MDRKRIISHLGEDWTDTMALIRETLDTDIVLLQDTNASILSHGGKQLRPMLSLLMARACGNGKCNQDSFRYAAASEMLHNATLLHDDVADKSSKRRGFPTVASLLGPSAAVLVGDFWLARAVETVLSADNRDKVVRLFSKTLTDLAEGEMIQLQKAESSDTSEEDYYRIIYCKTASLFVSACVSGAISVGAPEQQVEAAGRYAGALGLAFQIKDDILDYVGEEEIGKPLGIDLLERKMTLPLLGALSSCADPDSVRQMVHSIPSEPGNVAKIRAFVLESGGIGYATERLDGYVKEAVSALDAFPPSADRDMLSELAYFTSSRTL